MSRLTTTHISRSQAAKSRTRRIDGKRQKRQADAPVLHPLLKMQQTHGNQAVGRYIQAQQKDSRPGDQYEQEADRVANHVMRMPDTVADDSKQSMMQPPTIQRLCSECETEMQRQPIEEDKKPDEQLQRQAKPGHNHTVHPNIHYQITHLQSGGRPLPQAERAFFESRFGRDFSQVRVHTDGQAALMAKSINAKAFTVGRNIAFGSGEYQTETTSGRKLLAHELTHVVQQSGKNHVMNPHVHRKIGDGHDLQSVCLACDPVLEACFDGDKTQYLRYGSEGAAVKKVQQVLLALNYPLPKFGADGKFKDETAIAVSKFKKDNHIYPSDPVVGAKTVAALDAQCPLAGPPSPCSVPPSPVPPVPVPPSATKVCGPNVTAEVSRIWGKIQSDFSTWSFGQKESACRYLIQPLVPGKGGKWGLNQDAFDVIGLFQGSADWLRAAPYHPPCAVPGTKSPGSTNSFDPGHEDPSTCSNTVHVGSNCWLSGTVNYGTYGIMMKLCSDWTAPLRHLPGIGAYHSLFSATSTAGMVAAYKLYKKDDPTMPVAWALATYVGGPSATVGGSNRTDCKCTCPVSFSGPTFSYVWEPTVPR